MRIPVMVLFTLGCFAVLLFLWVSFGGSLPLKPNKYEVIAHFPEAATLAEAADVRMAGVRIGKAEHLQLSKSDGREQVDLLIDPQYAPLAKDTQAILRQKTLLGETFVELTPGNKRAGTLKDGSVLSNSVVAPTVELDEILRIFDPATKKAFQDWVAESAAQTSGSGGQDLNDALGNLAGFAQDGAGVFSVLNQQSTAVRGVVRDTGVVFHALGERQGQLAGLIRSSNNTFATTAREQNALADTFQIFPTFLDQSRFTLARLQTFAQKTDPLTKELKPVADDLGPTVRDLGNLAPDLKTLFIKLKPVIKAAPTDLPQGARVLRGARPVFDALHVFLPEFNPILSYLNYDQTAVASFITDSGPALTYRINGDPASHMLPQFGVINGRSLNLQQTVPSLGAHQRLPPAQRLRPRAGLRHARELPVPEREAARPEPERALAAVLHLRPAAVQRHPVPVPGPRPDLTQAVAAEQPERRAFAGHQQAPVGGATRGASAASRSPCAS